MILILAFLIFVVFFNLCIVPENNIKSFNSSLNSFEYIRAITSSHILFKNLCLFLQIGYSNLKLSKCSNNFIIKLDILSIFSSKILLLFKTLKIPSFIY
jgi:hypothetical protein